MKSAVFTCAVVAALTSPTAAQVFDAELRFATPSRAVAVQGFVQQVSQPLPEGYAILNNNTAVRTASAESLGIHAQAWVTFSVGVTDRTAAAKIEERTETDAQWFSFPSKAYCGQHTLDFTIMPRAGRYLTGTIETTHERVSATGATHTGSASVAFPAHAGGGGWSSGLPIQETHTTVRQVTVPPTGLSVRLSTQLSTEANGLSSATFEQLLEVKFTDRAGGHVYAWFTQYGTGCGPDLTGRELFTGLFSRWVYYDVTGAPASAACALIVGLTRTNLPIAGGCFVNTEPTASVLTGTSPSGTLELGVRILPWAYVSPQPFNVQCIALDGALLRSSNGLETELSGFPRPPPR